MIENHQPIAPVRPSHGRLRPLGLAEVKITGGFWAERRETVANVTLRHIAHWLEREGWIGNFDLAAAGTLPTGRRGREFSDSEVYKFLEAAAWKLADGPDEWLETTFVRFAARVAAAQEPDGYLNTNFGRAGQAPRWSDLAMGHELYCLGHLFQAAVARGRTAPGADDGLVAVATAAADLICDVFADGGIESVCGHPEVEVGLAELSRLTGNARYLEQARLFIDRRGHQTLPDHEWGRAYYQDDLPIREATILRGHAVRANYLSAGATDVAVETEDTDLLDALVGQWRRTIARRTYLTGGQGSHFQDEAFGEDWELPPDRSYSETCASVGSTMFSWRLLLATGNAEFADHMERLLYNMVATGLAKDGNAFFYTNTLYRRDPGTAPDPDRASPRAFSSLRAPWFEVSCCGPNIARTLASLPSLIATVDSDGLQVHQFATARIASELDDGTGIAVSMDTQYPSDGRVRLRIEESSTRAWTLTLRVPSWAKQARLVYRSADGAERLVPVNGSTVSVTDAFEAGAEVELMMDMTAEFVRPDPRIDAIRGCVAVQRGPLVFCAESLVSDPARVDLASVVVDDTVAPRYADGRVTVVARWPKLATRTWPYSADGPAVEGTSTGQLRLLPYQNWGNAGLATMRVWLPAGRPE
jgi:Uncharacterized protein conserved in bacteria